MIRGQKTPLSLDAEGVCDHGCRVGTEESRSSLRMRARLRIPEDDPNPVQIVMAAQVLLRRWRSIATAGSSRCATDREVTRHRAAARVRQIIAARDALLFPHSDALVEVSPINGLLRASGVRGAVFVEE